ncbi:MAG: bifunctional riboflavin kinase/FAD synthetase [Methylococcales bacterium]|jgi:riboflavin kinase/FMN adenylyltransferase|nr:bifunctional riboflavin kinase/FAD synthetase [Methylococcaceae bacterium]
MQLIRHLTHLGPLKEGCVLSIGNFDGVHSGHQTVIKKLAAQGKSMNLPVVLMLFEPQPLEFFLGDNAPSRLMRLREKVIQLKLLPIDMLLIVKFNQLIANYKAENFISDFLVNKLNVKHLVIGDDFHFGKARCGNFAMLQEKGLEYGFNVENTHSYLVEGHRVSSTLIRDALVSGDLVTAKQMLGRDYSVCGRVAHGQQRGRTIGFPTANIQMFRKNTPLSGVYAVTMTGINNQEIAGVANVGTRPTIDGGNKVILETHLFDFDQEIYGQYVEVHFKQKIRDEERFDSMHQLKTQIEQDIIIAKQILNS